ncbi:chitin synthase-domain-containing protein [Globomyces pollinis-pini]|nr:chitin synthase-domain-containing protein [Globomyces pollinis-pini]
MNSDHHQNHLRTNSNDPVVLRVQSNRTDDSLFPRLDIPTTNNASLGRRTNSLGRLTRPERQLVQTPRQRNLLEAEKQAWTPWSIFSNVVTCCIPNIFLDKCGKMHEREKQQAWREKVALCLISLVLMAALGFLTFGLRDAICIPEPYVFSNEDVGKFSQSNRPHNVIIHGIVYDISWILKSHPAIPNNALQTATGIDVTSYFPNPLSPTCSGLLKERVTVNCSTSQFPGSVHCHNNDYLKNIYKIGPVYYSWEQVDKNKNLMVYNGYVLDLTNYYAIKAPFGAEVDKVVRQFRALDSTQAIAKLKGGLDIGTCLTSMYVVGRLEAESFGCWASELILWISLIIVLGLVLIRFVFAVFFSWFISWQLGKLKKKSSNDGDDIEPNRKKSLIEGKYPIPLADSEGNLIMKEENVVALSRRPSSASQAHKSHSSYGSEVHTIMLVTCYSEDENALRLTFDSLAATDYNEDYKVLFIIADGLIKGSGNDKTTPDLILDMLELDPNWKDPIPLSYRALAEGSKQHNMARVYVGWYNSDQRSVPTILVVKCGTPEETTKPGNRGKRDSQMILMRFLQRITFNERLSPLDFDLFQKLHYLMGVTPDHFEICLMVDADTKVAPDSLARMVASMVQDPKVMGLCGETRIGNKAESWVTRIQVFEYYLSHHMTKAFESMFGGVTCLPGCFCMWRIKAMKDDAWIPILCSPEIVSIYSQCVVDTLHKKNLLLLGEDRFLTTLMLRAFPRRKLIFVPRAFCKTTVPNTFAVLLSQRRRWINSTIHNLMELVLVNELCGVFCFSMQFVIFLELVGTVTLPAAICFTIYLVVTSITSTPQILPLMLLAAILGLPAVLIGLTTRRIVYIYWMFVYLLALPIWNFVLPVYSFWHFDDFSWGQTRKVDGDTGDHGSSDKAELGADEIPLRKWDEWERDRRANMVINYKRRHLKN